MSVTANPRAQKERRNDKETIGDHRQLIEALGESALRVNFPDEHGAL
jgi:hypothetical protein